MVSAVLIRRVLLTASLLNHSGGALGSSPTSETAYGTVQGFTDANGNKVFLGIPFAATTGGVHRWRRPQAPVSSIQVFNATSFGPTCPQAIADSSLFTRQDEDCLNLNVWAPATGSDLPVFVYMYGGAMVTGSSSNPQLQGNNFADKGVILVTFNMRESIFASPFSAELNGTAQNFGILDVEFAMEWIHDNIAAFGGNPDHIVIGGHSSGSVMVDHFLWNHPDTFVVGAIEMSANSVSGPAYAPMSFGLDVIAAEVGCATGPGLLDCLRDIDFYDLETTTFNASAHTWFTPVIDNITRYSPSTLAERFAVGLYPSHVPLITGNSNGEGNIFALVYGNENANFSSWVSSFDADVAHIPHDELIQAYNQSDFDTTSLMSGKQYGDARFDCAVEYLVDLRSTNQDTWVYRFFGEYDNVVGVPRTAPTHGTEIPFFFGGNECFSSLSGVTAEQQLLADSINDWFVAWIKDPSQGPGWSKVTPSLRILAKLGVAGDEESILEGSMSDYNGICKSVYSGHFSEYPAVQSPL